MSKKADVDQTVRVLVTGPNDHVREAITGVIYENLRNVGFADVETLNAASVSITLPRSESMLSAVRDASPGLFSTPVRIQGSFADVKDRDAKGAFGPVAVGRFAFNKKDNEWAHISSPDLVDPHTGEPPINTVKLFVDERDYELVRKWTGKDEEEEGESIEAKLIV